MAQCKSTNARFRKWLLTKEYCGHIMVSPLMWLRCFNIQYAVKKRDYDHFMVISGLEGMGKSTCAIQLASILDDNWNLSKLLYEPSTFVDKIENSVPGDVLVLDEGNLFLFSRESMSSDNRFMVKLFALMRQKNIIVIINVPNFFTLDSYVRDHRTNTLIYVHRRGQFRVFVKKAINIISKQGFRFKQVGGVKVPLETTFPGYFTKDLPMHIDNDEYLEHKHKNFSKFIQDVRAGVKATAKPRESDLMTIREAKQLVPLSDKTFVRMIKKGKLGGKQISNRWFVNREQIKEMVSETKNGSSGAGGRNVLG